MLKLIDGTELTEEIKEAFKRGVTKAYIKLTDGTEINADNYLQSLELEDIRYNEETGNFIGEAVARRVTLEIYNENNSIDLEDKEFEVFIGAKLTNGTIAWISYGNFIVQKPENDDTKEKSEIEAFDYMCKFNKEYKPNVTFPCTYAELAEDVCEQCGVELGSNSFRNAENLVLDNFFINNEQCRVVIKQIAKIAFSWARIRTDNKLYFDFENNTNKLVSEEFILDDYINLNKNNQIIPVNTIILRNSSIEGENVTIVDEELIKEYGKQKELVVKEDYFAYDEASRRTLIQASRELFGLVYVPIEVSGIGTAYLENNDFIAIIDKQGNARYSYCLNHIIKYNGTLYDSIESPAMTETETKYQNESKDDLSRRRTEILVDKANQRIESVVELTTEQNEKINRITQTVDELNSKISDVADLTISAQDINAKVILEDINESEPIRVVIRPAGENISYLYPRNDLFPSENLFPKTRTLRFENTKTQEIFDYELPDNLYFYNSEYYDEFILDYDSHTCLINKKIGMNDEGETYILENPRTVEYEYPKISITDGDYTISILGYNYGYLFVRLMATNIYTTQFATKAELSSEISQLSNEIGLEVSQKVNDDEIIASLNIAVKNKQGILELIGNVLKIVTDNFNLTEDGHMTAKAGTIAGWNINQQYLGKGLAGIQGIGNTTSDDTVFYAGKGLGHGGNPAFYVTNKGNTHVKSLDIRGASSSDVGQIKVYSESSQVGSTITYSTVDSYNLTASNGGTTPTKGKAMHGYDMVHDFRCRWNDAKLYFIVDDTNIGYVTTSSSDARLKKDITDIPQELIYAITEVELKQFKLIDGNGKYKFGIIAQDLVNAFKKYGLDYREYEIISEVQVDLTDETLYFFINYEQVLILKNQFLEDRVKKLENKLEKILNKLGEV